MKIIITSPGRGIRLTGERETLSLEGRRREYVQVNLDGSRPYGCHIGWARVEDVANALDTVSVNATRRGA